MSSLPMLYNKISDKLQRLHLKPHLEGGHLERETRVTS